MTPSPVQNQQQFNLHHRLCQGSQGPPPGYSRRVALCCRQGEDAAPPRVMVFASSQEAAAAAAQPLRNVLWGQHNISVLLPEGEEPIKVGQGACLLGKFGITRAWSLLS